MSRDDSSRPSLTHDDTRPRPPEALAQPQIALIGEVDAAAVLSFRDQLRQAETGSGDIVMEVTTLGGDAEMARRIVLEIDAARGRLAAGRRFLFLGKTVVYSAGVTILAAFPRADRWLAHDTVVMIHCRKLDKTVDLSGPIRASLPELRAIQNQIETGVQLENENFRRLIEGSDIPFEEVEERALSNWYLDAEEARRRGLVAGIWRG